MIEDQLNKEQRIRLEALAQSVASTVGMPIAAHIIIERAKSFESYIRTGRDGRTTVTNG